MSAPSLTSEGGPKSCGRAVDRGGTLNSPGEGPPLFLHPPISHQRQPGPFVAGWCWATWDLFLRFLGELAGYRVPREPRGGGKGGEEGGCLELAEMDTENRHYKLTTLIDGPRGRDDAGRSGGWAEEEEGPRRTGGKGEPKGAEGQVRWSGRTICPWPALAGLAGPRGFYFGGPSSVR
ncbi:hypothetical protein KM043_009898 [Ampulex compressa]|nr:hypothetical protein KM043_009898 [Ampulex compressa]